MSNLSFLQADGEMAELTRNFNWDKTALGSPQRWAQSLRTTVSIVLNSKFPMFLWWGSELIQFYNDAYRASLGNNGKHPAALGQRAEDCWPEIWDYIKPLIDQVLTEGKSVSRENDLLPIYRNGKMEDVYWTFSYSPARDDEGKIVGVLVVCSETTENVLNLKKLEETADELGFAIESAELGIWDFNAVTKGFKGNDRLKEWHGVSGQDEIPLSYLLSIIDEKDKPAVLEAMNNALDTTTPDFYEAQFTLHPPGKKSRIVRAKGRAWFDRQNKRYRFSGTMLDVTEEVIALRKLEENEHQVRSFVESAPFPIGVYTGPEMRIQFANQSMLDAWGKGNDVIGKKYEDVLPELQNQKVYNQLDSVFKTGIPFHAYNQQIDLLVLGKLTRYYFNYSFTPLYSGYDIYGVMNTAADVTALNIAHKKLEESEQNLRNTILQAPVAMCIFRGPNHVVEIANERMFELIGKDAEAVLGKPIFEGVYEAADQGFEAILEKVYYSGETFKAFSIPIDLPRNGEIKTVYLDLLYEPFKETAKEITGVIVVATEVTEQVVARKRIEEAEERGRIAIESAELGTYQIDLLTGEIKTSPRFDIIWDVSNVDSRDEVVAHVHPEDRMIRQQAHEKALLTGRLYYEARVVWNDLSIHWIKVTGKIIYNADHQPATLLGVVQDITAQKEIEHQKDAFVATVSHELKTPITSMKVYCHLLLEKFSALQDEASTAMVSNMNMQINRLNYIIQDLLDVTRIEANKIRFRNDHFDFNSLVKEIVDEVQVTKPTHEIIITDSEPVKIFADKERTSQVLTNLLTNAIRYSPNADKVIVSANLKDGEVICSVQDFGTGIEKEKQSKIFERFYQVPEVNRANAGFGLGLYISSQIIQRQNGKIWVESDRGNGSTFYFSLPVNNN